MRKGFTLVEVSIVLVIISLILGAVAMGDSLVQASKIRSSINDLYRYKNAFYLFKEKYYYWPGDMPNATAFWPSLTNGDGDWSIACGNECMYLWTHLSKAGSGLIDGYYTGWSPLPFLPITPTRTYGGTGSQIFIISSAYVGQTGVFEAIFEAGYVSDIYKMDLKMDDGIPDLGSLLAGNGPAQAYLCVKLASGAYRTNNSAPVGGAPGSYDLTCTQKPGIYYAILLTL
jgi:prepilin-type N-terminal cleavage/methylation domain-containing protein